MAKAQIEIVGDASSYLRALHRSEQASGRFGDSTHKLGSRLGGLAKASVFAAGAAGVGAFFGALKVGWGEFEDSRKKAAQTAAVIQSTGGAAHVTAGHVADLSGKLLKQSGVDDEVITSGENMLLTFTNIRNEVGRGNDIFDQATQTVLDMSTALGEDVPKASIQLGKALQDPVKGVGNLRRVGVDLTDKQKDLIKQMVATGDTMGAQKIILHELNTEFGGSAKAAGETLPGKLSVLREELKNVAGEIVGGFTPALKKIIDRIGDWLGNVRNQQRVIRDIRQAARNLADFFRNAADLLIPLGKKINDIAGRLGGWKRVLKDLVGAWAGFKTAGIVAATATAVANVAAADTTAAAWKAALISTGFGALAVAAGIAAAEVIQHWQAVKRFFAGLWRGLEIGAAKAALAIVEPFTHLRGAIGHWAQRAKALIQAELDRLEFHPPVGTRGPSGTPTPGGPGAGPHGPVGASTVHVTVNLDGRTIADATLPHHQRHHRRQPTQVRGRRPGHSIALN